MFMHMMKEFTMIERQVRFGALQNVVLEFA
jgi:hypothetical protein